jgi:hypothetical protein
MTWTRHAGQARDLQAVALRGRAFLHRVQEHQVGAVLLGVEMHVGELAEFLRQLGQLEIVGGEQRERAGFLTRWRATAQASAEAVEGDGAAADLVHQHQAVGAGVVQDVAVSVISTMKVERPAGEVVGGADAGEDLVDADPGRPAGTHRPQQAISVISATCRM